MRKYVLHLGGAALGLLAGACSVTRRVPVQADAVTLRTYLAEHPASDLRVTDRAGKRYWMHAPQVRGDSLVGRQGYGTRTRPLGVGVDQIAELRTGHLSAGRTTVAVGGVLVAAGVAILLVADDPQPVHID